MALRLIHGGDEEAHRSTIGLAKQRNRRVDRHSGAIGPQVAFLDAVRRQLRGQRVPETIAADLDVVRMRDVGDGQADDRVRLHAQQCAGGGVGRDDETVEVGDEHRDARLVRHRRVAVRSQRQTRACQGAGTGVDHDRRTPLLLARVDGLDRSRDLGLVQRHSIHLVRRTGAS